MKPFSLRSQVSALITLVCATLLLAAPSNKVTYNPPENLVQGDQPLNTSYVVTITGPGTLIGGNTVILDLSANAISVLSKPAGVTDADALSFISISPSTLTFTGPSQVKTFTVVVSVPLGTYAGDYKYKILPVGWPSVPGGVVDPGHYINARAFPPGATDTSAPTVTLQSPADRTVYTYSPASGNPVNVSVNFTGSVGPNGSPIDTMLASIHTPAGTDLPVSLSTGLLPSLSTTASGSVPLTIPGNYTVTVAAGNSNGTSYASSNISVVVNAPPPSIAISSPAANSAFSYTLGGAGASVPVTFSATSIYGNVTSLAATLDGNPVTLATSGVNASLVATGSATLTLGTTGSHSLTFTAANDYGAATPVTVPFTVTGTAPIPTIAINSPTNGTSYTRSAGDPPTAVNYTFQGGTSYGKITAVVVSLDGVPVAVAPTVTGIGTANITGNGSLSFSAGGSHTLNVKLTNDGGAMASASTSFTINQAQPQVCEDLTWLPPISFNKTVEGGSEMPIKFTLDCHNKFVRDTAVLIAIYEVFRDGSTSTPVIHHYGTGSPNPPDYAIEGKQYHLNFDTAKGTHSYQIEVYTPVSGTMRLLGHIELNTTGGKNGHGDDDEHDDGGHDSHGGDGHGDGSCGGGHG